jgi:hypothetical protein
MYDKEESTKISQMQKENFSKALSSIKNKQINQSFLLFRLINVFTFALYTPRLPLVHLYVTKAIKY